MYPDSEIHVHVEASRAARSIQASMHHACMVLYHWSSGQFSSTWYDTMSILVARGRAKVGVAASAADWSKRIRDMQYADYDDHTVGS
jgi:hypothetical protein